MKLSYTCIGTYTFAVIHAMESYDALETGLKDVMAEINEVIHTPKITIDESEYVLDIFLGGDYKVHVCIFICKISPYCSFFYYWA